MMPINLQSYTMTERDVRDILFYLSGYCAYDKKFQEGLSQALNLFLKKKETPCSNQ